MTSTEEAATGNPGVVRTATRQPEEGDSARGNIGVASAIAGQPGEGEMGPDGGVIQGCNGHEAKG